MQLRPFITTLTFPMNKNLFALLSILFSAPVMSWETSYCQGEEELRIEALKQLRITANSYIENNGELPNICHANIPEIRSSIPESLASYMICGGSEEGVVYYSCLSERGVTETCSILLGSGQVECRRVKLETEYGSDPSS